jgi:hypothetical protein
MNVTIRVDLTADKGETEFFEICQLEHPYRELDPSRIDLLLAGEKAIPHGLHRFVVATQVEEVCLLRLF